MSKGFHRRPEDAAAIARNWPFGSRDMLDLRHWTQEMRDDAAVAYSECPRGMHASLDDALSCERCQYAARVNLALWQADDDEQDEREQNNE